LASYVTVCIDIYGRVYELSKEHPSWEQFKKSGKQSGDEKCIVRNAFTCTIKKYKKLKAKSKKKKSR